VGYRIQGERVRRGARVLRRHWSQAGLRALEALDRPPVVVYSWSKTGSTTAHETLARSRLWRPVYHVHSLDDGVEERQAKHASTGNSLGLSPEELRVVRRLRAQVQAGDTPMAVVTLVRDPISRSISSFFQRHYGSGIDMTAEHPSAADIAATIEQLHERLPKFILATDVWFDRQLRGGLGVDLFAEPFDPEVGFARVRHGAFDQAVIRTDRFDELYRPALEPILGRRLGPVRRVNDASSKRYRAHHRATLEVFRLSDDEIDQALATRVIGHFFSPAERDALARSWRGGAPAAGSR